MPETNEIAFFNMSAIPEGMARCNVIHQTKEGTQVNAVLVSMSYTKTASPFVQKDMSEKKPMFAIMVRDSAQAKAMSKAFEMLAQRMEE